MTAWSDLYEACGRYVEAFDKNSDGDLYRSAERLQRALGDVEREYHLTEVVRETAEQTRRAYEPRAPQEPRVWRDGDADPGPTVTRVCDHIGLTYTRRREGNFHPDSCASGDLNACPALPFPWVDLARRFGPLSEVSDTPKRDA